MLNVEEKKKKKKKTEIGEMILHSFDATAPNVFANQDAKEAYCVARDVGPKQFTRLRISFSCTSPARISSELIKSSLLITAVSVYRQLSNR